VVENNMSIKKTLKADPVLMQVLRYSMEQIADEMGHTLIRTAR
jgi:N-methylhydantoinase B/oxoprolinase/acetone carboxylase alpha subunit